MNLTNDKNGDFLILHIDGRVDTSNSAIFEAEIESHFSSGEKNFIFDCSGLNYISSSGLRVFLVAQKKAILAQGKLHLCCMQPSIREIFVISGFSTIFRIFDTLEEALVQ